ncbi:MAG: hypothetical protein HDS80_06650 [Bacteroidales bacterium]|nr:hypothetical protein [Bacteroidales bacterium]
MKLLHSMVLAAGLTLPGLAFAGNIPQYTLSNQYTTGLENALGEGWEFFTDGTTVGNSTSQVASAFIFADGTQSINGYRGAGFPIGFDFRMGGNTFNQFTVCANGMIQLGKDQVDYRGCGIPFISKPLSYQYESPFIISMAPMMYGVRSGEVSYKTVGEAGNRVLVVQFYKMVLDDIGSTVDSRRSKFSLQIRLHEADGKIEMAFVGDYPFSSNGFMTGLHGWDQRDQAIVTGSVTAKKQLLTGVNASMLEPETYISWSDQADDNESFVLTFTPAANTPAPANAPTDLKIEQVETSAVISCKKAEGADATMILVSNEPFTDADFPTDGISYRVHDEQNGFGTKIGNATLIYYRNDENPTVTVDEIEPDATLYVAALSVNGYPNYNKTNPAKESMAVTQLPPDVFYTTVDEEGVTVKWDSELPVIVAYSAEAALTDQGYYGVFNGVPEADVKVGDELPGGGKVIYVGEDDEMFIPASDLRANYPSMFKIWNVKDGVVSASGANTFSVPVATLPYEPELELWPFGQLPVGTETSNDQWGWTPRRRDYDKERTFNGTLPNNEKDGTSYSLTFTTPELPFTTGEAVLEFEWAMETQKPWQPADPSNPDGPQLAQGAEPGWFGEVPGATPGLTIGVGPVGDVKDVKTITEYNGKMVEYNEGSNWDGSASWQKESIPLGVLSGKQVLTFTGCAQRESVLMIRKIKVDQNTGVIEVPSVAEGVSVIGLNGGLEITAVAETSFDIYNLVGIRVATVAVGAGETVNVTLPAGLYVAAGKKVVVL